MTDNSQNLPAVKELSTAGDEAMKILNKKLLDAKTAVVELLGQEIPIDREKYGNSSGAAGYTLEDVLGLEGEHHSFSDSFTGQFGLKTSIGKSPITFFEKSPSRLYYTGDHPERFLERKAGSKYLDMLMDVERSVKPEMVVTFSFRSPKFKLTNEWYGVTACLEDLVLTWNRHLLVNNAVSAEEVDALVAFMETLTGTSVYTDEKWSSPFGFDGSLSVVVLTTDETEVGVEMNEGTPMVTISTPGVPRTRYLLKTSDDMVNWSEGITVTTNNNGMVSYSMPATQRARYFRYVYEVETE